MNGATGHHNRRISNFLGCWWMFEAGLAVGFLGLRRRCYRLGCSRGGWFTVHLDADLLDVGRCLILEYYCFTDLFVLCLVTCSYSGGHNLSERWAVILAGLVRSFYCRDCNLHTSRKWGWSQA
jgi:hypothetical protein